MADIYDDIINDVRSMPKRRPRPLPQPTKFSQRVKRLFETSVADVANDIAVELARIAMGTRELEAQIPLPKLQSRIAHHAAVMFAKSINRGHFVRVMYADTFLVIFDWGDSRTLQMGCEIYRTPDTDTNSRSVITVKESEMCDPWDKVFERDEPNFDLVPEEPFVISADIHPVQKTREH